LSKGVVFLAFGLPHAEREMRVRIISKMDVSFFIAAPKKA
jgi:hypothetical protein